MVRDFSIRITFRAFPFLLALACAGSAFSAENYPVYLNSRNGFEIAYPASFVAHGESDSGDGQLFTSATNDAELRAYATYCTTGEDVNPARQIAKYIREAKQGKSEVTYQRRGKAFAVVSGTTGDRVFYRKLLIGGNTCFEFRFEYPYAQKEKYDAFTTRIESSFRLLPSR